MAATAEELKQQIIEHTGDVGTDAEFCLRLPLATDDGTFDFTVGNYTVADIPADIMPGDFTALLEAELGAGNVAVNGLPMGPYRIRFTGALGAQAIEDVSADGANLEPAADLTVEPYQQGSAPRAQSLVDTAWTRYSDIADLARRRWYAEVDVLTALRNATMQMVDTETGDRREKLSQQFAMLNTALNDAKASLADYETETVTKYAVGVVGRLTNTTGNGQTFGKLAYDSTSGRYK